MTIRERLSAVARGLREQYDLVIEDAVERTGAPRETIVATIRVGLTLLGVAVVGVVLFIASLFSPHVEPWFLLPAGMLTVVILAAIHHKNDDDDLTPGEGSA